jgi:hypothetical protein
MSARPDAAGGSICPMRIADAFRRSSSRLPAEAATLRALLRDDPAQGLAALPRIVEAIGACEATADARLATLEPLRPALIECIEPVLHTLRGQPIPLQREELAAFHRLSLALRALRDAFKRVHADLCDLGPDAAAGTLPPRAMLALARALDLQSRLLVAAARSRIAAEREQWDELCRLAHPLWRLSAIDEAFPEPLAPEGGGARRRGDAPRSAFALPLLMRLLEPLGLSGLELDVAHGLARGAARRAGVRIDLDGDPHLNPDGPALMLSAHHTVQIDTRETVAALRRCVARLAAGDAPATLGLRTTLAPAGLVAVLERLGGVWGAQYVPTPLVRPPVAQALLLLGLPRRVRDAARRTAAPDRADAAPGASVYEYGRGRPGLPGADPTPAYAARLPGEAAPVERDPARELLVAHGEKVAWRGQDARRAVFARSAEGPRLRLGQLVAVLPRRPGEPARVQAARPGSGPTRVLLGRVVTLAQTGCADGRQPFAHDLGVAFWPGAPRAVRIQLDGATSFEDAWWFPATTDALEPSLVLRRDLFERPIDVCVRDPGGDRELRIRGLVERGVDFDRVALAAIG